MTKKTKPAADPKSVLIVLGYDEHGKPCGARFTGADPELVNKAAKAMGLQVYKGSSSEDVAEAAKKLPPGQLYANGRGFMPNVRQEIYSDMIVALAPIKGEKAALPPPIGLPKSWDEIAPGHLVIAQESLAVGWCEALVLARDGDMFTLRYRDYSHLPKFVRHRKAIALMSPAAE